MRTIRALEVEVPTVFAGQAHEPRALDLEADALDVALRQIGPLAELLIVPEVVYVPAGDGATVPVRARKAEGTKCPRCWQVKRDGDEAGLCARCQGILSSGKQAR